MGCLLQLIVNTITLMVVAGFFTGFELDGVGAAVMASIILTFINMFIRPFLVFLTLPITVFSLGLFLLVINAALLLLTASLMGEQFTISHFGMALFAAVLISLLNLLIHSFIVNPLRK